MCVCVCVCVYVWVVCMCVCENVPEFIIYPIIHKQNKVFTKIS